MKIQLMRICPSRFWTFSGNVLFWLLASYPVTAQITPDTTLPVNSTVTPEGNIRVIEGGTQRGGNLFHSFREFSFSVQTSGTTGDTAFFNNDSAVTNIITRVTGESTSNIDGIIRANGSTTNLFFINPNGIIFGPNARLDIRGSFVASTADSLRFADGTEFSATNPQATPVLTVSVPLGLQFGSNSGEIVNRSTPPGLEVASGKTLALVGGNVSLQGGNLTASGRIELGSVGTGLVNLTEVPQGYDLGYSGEQNFLDIDLSGGAQVNANGASGGSIQVRGRNINLTGGSAIFSGTLGAGTGGTLTVNAAEFVNLRDGTELSTYTEGTGSAGNLTLTTEKLTVESGARIASATLGAGTGGTLTVNAAAESVNLSGDGTLLTTYTEGTGSAGDLTIKTRTLTVKDGASIQTFTQGLGQAGDLLVTATDAVELSGTTTDGRPSGLFAQVRPQATGNGGNLTVETGRLTIRDGANINASTFGAGRAGDVLVKASDIELQEVGTTPSNGRFSSSGIYTQVEPQATGNAGTGNLTIETQRLTVEGGAKISTATFSRGNGGELTINATASIILSGASERATASPLDTNRSGIFVSAEEGATGNVGKLTINTGQLTVENGAKISADNIGSSQETTQSAINVRQLFIRDGGQIRSGSFASGAGGTLSVNATESVSVIGTTTIDSTQVPSTLSAAATASGKAGNLNITTRRLNVQNRAEVSVSGTGTGSSAGNLTITANDIRLNGGRLSATTNTGEEAANIRLQNVDLLLLQNGSLISATASDDANGGNININAANGVVVAVPGENNDIIARASQGRGGEINITASGIFGIEEREPTSPRTNDINASSDFGLPGTVIINRPEVEPNEGLLELPTTVVDASGLVDTGCAALAGAEGSTFFVTGRGGLPPSPDEPLSTDVLWSDTRMDKTTAQRSQTVTTAPAAKTNTRAIVPATGWVFNGKGEVTLISHASGTTSSASTSATCYQQ
ncbi:filamentous hemagglutinin N-terminal domain-containing protein [Scytonema sp. UIC 10036]|nr:filamentous hemagglutinin N-terminal domain-containing protein [Scytonema sp. UIC 10036]